MPARKTVSVNNCVTWANSALENSGGHRSYLDGMTPEQAYRRGIASMLEKILHHTGNYKGFGYHNVDFTTDPPTIPDETRRNYYYNSTA